MKKLLVFFISLLTVCIVKAQNDTTYTNIGDFRVYERSKIIAGTTIDTDTTYDIDNDFLNARYKFLSSVENWQNFLIVNYFKSGVRDTKFAGSRLAGLEVEVYLQGIGTPPPVVNCVTNYNNWRYFRGTYNPDFQGVFGTSNVWVVPDSNISNNISVVHLFENYITDFSDIPDTVIPASWGDIQGFTFRIGGSNFKKYTKVRSYYSDLSNYAVKLVGTENYHFYGNGDVPSYFGGLVIGKQFKSTIFTASLTDGVPTDAEIDAATSTTPATIGSGWECWIKDSDGTGLIYRVVSDGTDWYYFNTTKAL